ARRAPLRPPPPLLRAGLAPPGCAPAPRACWSAAAQQAPVGVPPLPPRTRLVQGESGPACPGSWPPLDGPPPPPAPTPALPLGVRVGAHSRRPRWTGRASVRE